MTDESQKYLLDSNVFIEAHRRYYSFDICPGFWECLSYHHDESTLYSIDKVKDELMTGDALGMWVRNSISGNMFHSTDGSDVVQQFSSIIQEVQMSNQYNHEAKSEFAQIADGWLVAYAKTHDFIVVTHEVYNPDIRKKIPIPNLCREYGVSYIDTFNMLRDLNAQFNWK